MISITVPVYNAGKKIVKVLIVFCLKLIQIGSCCLLMMEARMTLEESGC